MLVRPNGPHMGRARNGYHFFLTLLLLSSSANGLQSQKVGLLTSTTARQQPLIGPKALPTGGSVSSR